MNTFHYAQARLQARHSLHLPEEEWSRLAAIPSFTVFLKQARDTSLARWLHSIGPTSSHHEADLSLRLSFRHHVAEVAAWLPSEWHPATRWLATLVDLPLLLHRLHGHPIPAALQRDELLAPLANVPPQWGSFTPLIQRWQQGEPPTTAWMQHWHSLWPANARKDRSLLSLMKQVGQVGGHLEACDDPHLSRALHLRLQELLAAHFRRHLFHVSVAFAHLGLVALELERLRGAICRRLLFPNGIEEKAP
ncbi:MAG: hypothetical protein G8345_11855 [Magnetococcales bacterium]|nr:hypothetical protein [Magnetococcales bacterium]NGZ27566.1 hypothetical protein [Magnetococcales bacterium]